LAAATLRHGSRNHQRTESWRFWVFKPTGIASTLPSYRW